MKQLMDLAPAEPACLKADPNLFDRPEHYPAASMYCEICPVQGWCLQSVDPAHNYYDGVVGGLAWLNGRVVAKPPVLTPEQQAYWDANGDLTQSRPRRRQNEYDWVRIHNFVEGLLHWRTLSTDERKVAAHIMARRGWSWKQITETTHLNTHTVTLIKKTVEGNEE